MLFYVEFLFSERGKFDTTAKQELQVLAVTKGNSEKIKVWDEGGM
jgi:hypothetical protein